MDAILVEYNKRTAMKEQDLTWSGQWLCFAVTRVVNEHILWRQCPFINGYSRAMQSWLTALLDIFVDVFSSSEDALPWVCHAGVRTRMIVFLPLEQRKDVGPATFQLLALGRPRNYGGNVKIHACIVYRFLLRHAFFESSDDR
jgi:hypothetical protein